MPPAKLSSLCLLCTHSYVRGCMCVGAHGGQGYLQVSSPTTSHLGFYFYWGRGFFAGLVGQLTLEFWLCLPRVDSRNVHPGLVYFWILHFLYLLCMFVDVPQCLREGQRSTCGIRFSPSIMWVQGLELLSAGLASNPLYPPSHLTDSHSSICVLDTPGKCNTPRLHP